MVRVGGELVFFQVRLDVNDGVRHNFDAFFLVQIAKLYNVILAAKLGEGFAGQRELNAHILIEVIHGLVHEINEHVALPHVGVFELKVVTGHAVEAAKAVFDIKGAADFFLGQPQRLRVKRLRVPVATHVGGGRQGAGLGARRRKSWQEGHNGYVFRAGGRTTVVLVRMRVPCNERIRIGRRGVVLKVGVHAHGNARVIWKGHVVAPQVLARGVGRQVQRVLDGKVQNGIFNLG